MDQKKAAELAPLSETVMAPDATNPDSTILELDELWSNAREQDEPSLDLDRFVPQEPSSGRVCHWRSQPSHLSPFVGGHSTCLPYRSLLHRFLGSVSGRDPRRAAYGCRQGNR